MVPNARSFHEKNHLRADIPKFFGPKSRFDDEIRHGTPRHIVARFNRLNEKRGERGSKIRARIGRRTFRNDCAGNLTIVYWRVNNTHEIRRNVVIGPKRRKVAYFAN